MQDRFPGHGASPRRRRPRTQNLAAISAQVTASRALWMVNRSSRSPRSTTRISVAGPGQRGSVQIVSLTDTRHADPCPRRDRTRRLIRCLCQRAFAACMVPALVKTLPDLGGSDAQGGGDTGDGSPSQTLRQSTRVHSQQVNGSELATLTLQKRDSGRPPEKIKAGWGSGHRHTPPRDRMFSCLQRISAGGPPVRHAAPPGKSTIGTPHDRMPPNRRP